MIVNTKLVYAYQSINAGVMVPAAQHCLYLGRFIRGHFLAVARCRRRCGARRSGRGHRGRGHRGAAADAGTALAAGPLP